MSQHVKQGETIRFIKCDGNRLQIIENKTKNIENLVKEVVDTTKEFSNLRHYLERNICSIPVRTLEKKFDWNREDAIKTLLNCE